MTRLDEPAPSWHELVQPGPAGSPERRAQRAAAERHGMMIVEHRGINRATRRATHGRGWNPGRLVTHGPRNLRMFRRAARIRAAVAAMQSGGES